MANSELEILKKEAKEHDNIDTCYVLDKTRKLLGTVTLKSLLIS